MARRCRGGPVRNPEPVERPGGRPIDLRDSSCRRRALTAAGPAVIGRRSASARSRPAPGSQARRCRATKSGTPRPSNGRPAD